MWIRWRAEQAVMKQEVHTELWMEDLMKTPLRKAESKGDIYRTDLTKIASEEVIRNEDNLYSKAVNSKEKELLNSDRKRTFLHQFNYYQPLTLLPWIC